MHTPPAPLSPPLKVGMFVVPLEERHKIVWRKWGRESFMLRQRGPLGQSVLTNFVADCWCAR